MKQSPSKTPFPVGPSSSPVAVCDDLKSALNERLAREFRAALPAALVRRAVDEAEALALASGFPDLFFPELAAEKVHAVLASLGLGVAETAFSRAA